MSIPPFGRGFSRQGVFRSDGGWAAQERVLTPPFIVSMRPPEYPRHGCDPAVPASVSPGKIIVAPNVLPFLNLNIWLARDCARTQTGQTRIVSVMAWFRQLSILENTFVIGWNSGFASGSMVAIGKRVLSSRRRCTRSFGCLGAC